MGYVSVDDEVVSDTIQLEEIIVSKLDLDAKKRFLLLQSRVYPYAKLASERLTLLNKG
jgi:hypothetical protein